MDNDGIKELILVKKGLKPSVMFFSKKIFKTIDNLEYLSLPFFKEKRVIAFNLDSLSSLIPKLSQAQSSFKITSPKEVINLFQFRYSTKTLNWSKKERLDYILIEGIVFGYPIESIKLFVKELESKKEREDRIIYEVSPLISFIGYPEDKENCALLSKKWLDLIT